MRVCRARAVYVFLGSGAALADFLTLFRSRGLEATGEYVVIVPQDEKHVRADVDAGAALSGAEKTEGHALDEYRHVLFVAQHAVDTELIKRFHAQVLQRTFELWSPNELWSNHVVKQPTVRDIPYTQYCTCTVEYTYL